MVTVCQRKQTMRFLYWGSGPLFLFLFISMIVGALGIKCYSCSDPNNRFSLEDNFGAVDCKKPAEIECGQLWTTCIRTQHKQYDGEELKDYVSKGCGQKYTCKLVEQSVIGPACMECKKDLCNKSTTRKFSFFWLISTIPILRFLF